MGDVTFRLEPTRDTKRYRAFGITEEQRETAMSNGIGNLFNEQGIPTYHAPLESDLAKSSSVYLTISDTAPDGFEDVTVPKKKAKKAGKNK